MSVIQKDIVIIGAGLTGLSCAHQLKKGGADFLILEKSNRVGGVIQTGNEDGFIYEQGPNTGAISNPEVKELFDDLNGMCRLEVANPKAKRRLIWKENKWHALPAGIKSAVGTPLFSLKDKLRILSEPTRSKGDNPMESIADLVQRRLGQSYLDYAVDPFVSGVYAGDPQKLITRFALPKLYQLEQEYGSFIKGAIKKKKEPKDERMNKATKEVFSAENGLSNLTNAIAQKIGSENIILSANELQIIPSEEGGFIISYYKKGEQFIIEANQVVTTTASNTLPALLPFIQEAEMAKISNLVYAKIALVIAGYKKWSGIDINAFGGLVPSKEMKNLLGILFTSSFFKNRAPKDGALLSIFTGGARHPEFIDMSNEELLMMIKQEVKEMLKCTDEPDLLKVFRYSTAIPQYDASTEERYKTINKIQNQYEGLVLAGNIRDGIGMADRIKQGTEIALQLMTGKIKEITILK